MFYCTNCGQKTAVWGADFSFEDYGYEGEGIVSNYTCSNCGAEIEVRVAIQPEESKEETAQN